MIVQASLNTFNLVGEYHCNSELLQFWLHLSSLGQFPEWVPQPSSPGFDPDCVSSKYLHLTPLSCFCTEVQYFPGKSGQLRPQWGPGPPWMQKKIFSVSTTKPQLGRINAISVRRPHWMVHWGKVPRNSQRIWREPREYRGSPFGPPNVRHPNYGCLLIRWGHPSDGWMWGALLGWGPVVPEAKDFT